MTYFEKFVEDNKPLLQVALDLISMERAALLASSLLRNLEEPFIIEAGTPLIKSVGMIAIKVLSAIASTYNIPILADMKIADVGRLEVGLAADNGAAAITVLGIATDPTIIEALEESRKRKVTLVADLIHVDDIIKRASELEGLGVKAIEVHVSIDIQRRLGLTAREMLSLISTLAKKFNGIIAVAGGLNRDTAKQFAEAGVDIIIVGSAIHGARNPVAAAKEIQEAIKG